MVLTRLKDGLRSVLVVHGALYAMTFGTTLMLVLCAISWDFPEKV